MATKIIQCKLEPQGYYFFGGEKRFNGNDNEVNYYAVSNLFPQQTSLLGLLRQLVMEKNNGSKNEIGTSSFLVHEAHTKTMDFGAIKRLSPLFLSKSNVLLFPQAKEYSDDKQIPITHIKGTAFWNGQKRENIPLLENENYYKNEIDKQWISPDRAEKYKEDAIFKDTIRDGIIKNKGDDDTNAYYKQQLWTLNKGFAFVFFVEIDETQIPDNQTINLGGERSTFRLTISEASEENPLSNFEAIAKKYYGESAEQERFIIVSPTFPTSDFMDDTDFAVMEYIDFRNLETNINTENYNQVGKDIKKGAVRSEKKQLIQSGAILFPKDAEALAKALNKAEGFKQIGYNFYFKNTKNNA